MEDFEFNVHAGMTPFYIGSWCEDINSVIFFLDLLGGKSLSRSINTKSVEINAQLISICKDIVVEGLNKEIVATVCEKLDEKYTHTKRDRPIQTWL